jgi:hypothetical protein
VTRDGRPKLSDSPARQTDDGAELEFTIVPAPPSVLEDPS